MSEISLIPVLIRFVGGGTAVVASTLLARSFGGRIGGVFAAFPAVYLAAILSLSLDYRGEELLLISQHVSYGAVSYGALVGMFADIICAIAASRLIVKYGWKKGLSLALIIWLFASTGIYFSWQMIF